VTSGTEWTEWFTNGTMQHAVLQVIALEFRTMVASLERGDFLEASGAASILFAAPAAVVFSIVRGIAALLGEVRWARRVLAATGRRLGLLMAVLISGGFVLSWLFGHS
jgi:hypothetical protein